MSASRRSARQRRLRKKRKEERRWKRWVDREQTKELLKIEAQILGKSRLSSDVVEWEMHGPDPAFVMDRTVRFFLPEARTSGKYLVTAKVNK